MLVDWLGRMSIDEFRTRFLRLAPTAQPGTALAARSLLDWNVLDRVLRAQPDVLVVSRGVLLAIPPPRTVNELAEYFAGGVGLCIRHAQRHDDGLASVVAAFEPLGAAQVQLFV